MNKEEIEIIEKEINNLNGASQCALASGKERKDWLDTANAIKKMLEENKQLKEKCEFEIKCNTEFADRINKAIEYINEEYYVYPQELTGLVDGDELLEILKGDSNE